MTLLDTAGPPLATASQLALLRVLAMSHRRRLDPAPWIGALANERGGGEGQALLQLAATVSVGVPVIDALQQLPGLISPTDALSLRLGQETGTLSETYQRLSTRSPMLNLTPAYSPQRQLFTALFLSVISLQLLTFQAAFIWPTFEKISEEFELPRFAWIPSPLVWLMRHQAMFSLAMSLLIVMIITLLIINWHRLRSGRSATALWMANRDQRWLAGGGVLSMLAMVMRSGRPVASALATLARFHPQESVRARLVRASSWMQSGEASWDALAAERFLSTTEVRSLQRAASSSVHTWMLQRIAAKRQSRGVAWQSAAITTGSLLLFFCVAGLVAVTCITTFGWFANLIGGLA